MSKLKKLNKLNKSKTLNVALSVGLVAANLVSVVPAFAAGTDSAAKSVIMSTSRNSLSATSASYDKKNGGTLSVTYTAVNGATLSGIKNGIKTLTLGTDYTKDTLGTTVTFTETYLKSLRLSTSSIKFDFNTGYDPIYRIKVTDTSAKINRASVIFDANHPKDISVSSTTHGNTFQNVTDANGNAVTVTQTGSVTHPVFKISKDYLATLPNGIANLTFNFDKGTDPVLKVTVKNSNVAANALSSVTAATVGTNDTITANFSTAITDASGLVLAQTINGTKVNDYSTKTFTLAADGKSATVTVPSVAATTAAQSVVYSVTYKGVTKTSTITVPAVTNLAVSSVSAINLKQLQVVFNQAVDKTTAELPTNYVVNTPLNAVGTAAPTTTVATASLQPDGKTVLLTLTGSYTNQFTNQTISISNVKNASGVVLASTYTKTDLAGTDTTVPTVTSVSQVGPQTIDVYFSEPVTTGIPTAYTTTISTGDFAIDNGSMSVSAATATYAKNKVTLTLSSTLASGSHTVLVNNALGIHDFAGYSVVKSTQTFTATTITTAPTVSVSTAAPNKVVLKFSVPVKNVGSATIYHDFTNLTSAAPTITVGTGDGTYSDTWDVTFPTNYLTGSGTLYIKSLVGTEIQDMFANKMADTSLAVSPVSDTTAPTVVSVTASDNKTIKVQFSKDVLASDAINAQNYVFKNSSGTVLTSSTVTNLDAYGHPTGTITYNANTYTATIPFATAIPNGNYELTSQGIHDTVTYTSNILAANTQNFTVANTSLVTLQSAVKSGNTFVLTYSKAVATSGTGSALDINNYRIDWDGAGATYTTSALPTGSTVAIGASNNIVVITLSDTTNYSTGVTKISASINDSTGVAIDPFGNSQAVSNIVGIANTEVGNIRLLDNKTVTFEVTRPLQSLDVTKILIDGTAADSATFVNQTLSDGVTYGALVTAKISTTWLGTHGGTVYLDTYLTTGSIGIGGVAKLITFTAASFTDMQNVVSTATGIGLAGSTTKDYAHSTYTATTVVGATPGHIGEVDVTFSEPVLAGTLSTSSFTVTGYSVTNLIPVLNGSGNATGAKIIVNPQSAADSGATPKVYLAAPITDVSAQANVEAVDTASTAVTPADTVKPVVVSAAFVNKTNGTLGTQEAGDQIVITYSEAVTITGLTAGGAAIPSAAGLGDTTAAGTITGIGAFTTVGGITTATTTNTIALSADGKTVTITLGAKTGTDVTPSGTFTPAGTAADKAAAPNAVDTSAETISISGSI